MPLEVQLRTMREYWRQAHIGGKFDKTLADKAAVLAAACAPYCHPRLHAIDAKVETALIVMTDDERREQARALIAEAFAERPLQLIEGTVISDPEESDTSGVSVNVEVEAPDDGAL